LNVWQAESFPVSLHFPRKVGESMRRPLIVGNWKMYKEPDEAVGLARALISAIGGMEGERDVVICPPFVCLQPVFQVLRDSSILLGAQNMHWEAEGAYTGEISGAMILTCGCTYVILGHSERRLYCAETDATINRKLTAALQCDLLPIVCVGESLEQRQAGRAEEVVLGQMEAVLSHVAARDALKISLAYEPVWAIGSGKTATATQAEEVHGLMREFLRQQFGRESAAQIRILYGGSVKPENAADLFAQEDIDGGLIGGAALNAETFAAIVKTTG